MSLPTLLRQGNPLADPIHQLRVLAAGKQPAFEQTLARSGLPPLRATGIQVLQINVGKVCNQTCRHCHVDAGPDRREIMTRETVLDCLAARDAWPAVTTVDITGGAPELNPNFRQLVEAVRARDRHVIDRCNLTILLTP